MLSSLATLVMQSETHCVNGNPITKLKFTILNSFYGIFFLEYLCLTKVDLNLLSNILLLYCEQVITDWNIKYF